MTRETVALLIDDVEDFLDEKGVEIENSEREGDEGEAIIYGSDFDDLMERMRSTLRASNVYVSNTFNEQLSTAVSKDTLVIFIPSINRIVRIDEGSGDNLSNEDQAEGYVDYLMYDIYNPLEIGQADSEDGGQLMSKEYIRDKYESLIDAVPEVLDMAFNDENLSFIILGGGTKYKED